MMSLYYQNEFQNTMYLTNILESCKRPKCCLDMFARVVSRLFFSEIIGVKITKNRGSKMSMLNCKGFPSKESWRFAPIHQFKTLGFNVTTTTDNKSGDPDVFVTKCKQHYLFELVLSGTSQQCET